MKKDQNNQEEVNETMSAMPTHIRCLSVVPVELEELLAEIDAETAEAVEGQ